MKNIDVRRDNVQNQRGAALITVVMIAALLSIASIAILSGVGNNSRNSTDVLSESKAYYASESGLQATINVLRNDDTVDYKYAAANPTLSAKLPYNYPTSGTSTRAVIGDSPGSYDPNTGAAYSVFVTDPDNSAGPSTYQTSGGFVAVNGGTVSADFKTVYFPNSTDPVRTEISYSDQASTVNDYTSNRQIGTFTRTLVGGGVTIPDGTELKFRIDYFLTSPQPGGVINIFGAITQVDPTNLEVAFQTQNYNLRGSVMELCDGPTGGPNCTDVTFNLQANPSEPLYAYTTSPEPYRLRVVSTGYGPNGATKQLEGIIKKDAFGGLGSGAATTMLGTNATPPGGLPFLFDPGTSNGVEYSGGDCSSPQGCVPSFGLTDPDNLDYVDSHPPAGDPSQMQPPAALLSGSSLPDWQQSPAAMDALVGTLRTAALNSGRYFVNPTGDAANFGVGSNSNPPGDHTEGTGITFCEGSCKIGADGGGILVVTGKLTNVGGFDFKGIIIVTGEEGWERNGGGNGQIIGNIIIAPYNRRTYIPENHSTSFLAPRYYITGGGGSDVIYSDIGSTLDNTLGINNLMQGVAEK
ncbi:MAG: hypothetical protein HKN25_14460 [Pyrinomonadaceae bacterium]|nr:hypothetical protein [Pyrinomonadaceae bacterium]